MSQRSFLFGSVAGDRIYEPAAFARLYKRLIGTGVIDADGNELAVTQNSPAAMNVLVGTGSAFVLGYYFEVYGSAETVAISAAHATLPRIDRVIIRRDASARTMVLAVLTGTAASSPSAPALTQNESGTYEISLAQIAVPAASVSVVTANITDQRTFASAQLGSILDTSVGHDHDGSDSKAVTWANVASKPTAFNPDAHAHAAASEEGQVPYTNLSSIPSTFAPALHATEHGSGQDDPISHNNLAGLTTGDPHTQYQQESGKNAISSADSYAGLDNDASARVPAARLGTGSAVSTNVLLGDRTWGLVPVHASRHASGGADALTPANINAPSSYSTPATAGTFRIYRGTSSPTGMSEGDIWING